MTVFRVLVQILAKLIQSTSSQSVSERLILILPSHLFQVASFLHVSHQNPVGISLLFRRSEDAHRNKGVIRGRIRKGKEEQKRREGTSFFFLRTVPIGCEENLPMIEPLSDRQFLLNTSGGRLVLNTTVLVSFLH
jgi:hypothetical protein